MSYPDTYNLDGWKITLKFNVYSPLNYIKASIKEVPQSLNGILKLLKR